MFLKRVSPVLENCMYGSLQHKACNSEALRPEVIASRKTVFQLRYLRWQVSMGLNGAWLRAARTNSRHQVGRIIRGMPLVCSRSLIHLRMEGSMLRGSPQTVTCLRETAKHQRSLEYDFYLLYRCQWIA